MTLLSEALPFLTIIFSLYPGIIGSGPYDQPGGGSNYVCLPKNPKYDRYKDTQEGTHIYGTEYEVDSFDPFTIPSLHDHDAPCAVCYTSCHGARK